VSPRPAPPDAAAGPRSVELPPAVGQRVQLLARAAAVGGAPTGAAAAPDAAALVAGCCFGARLAGAC